MKEQNTIDTAIYFLERSINPLKYLKESVYYAGSNTEVLDFLCDALTEEINRQLDILKDLRD